MDQHRRPRGLSARRRVLGIVFVAAWAVGVVPATGADVADSTVRVAQADTTAPAGEAVPSPPPQTDPAAGVDPAAGTDAAAPAADEVAAEEPEDLCCKKGDRTPPFELIAQIPQGELNNPYDWRELAAEHQDDPEYLVKQFQLPGCGQCHGASGGGGFCPSLTQGVWLWGNTDDVLFRLIALGSEEMQRQGFTRYQQGSVAAPMAEMGHVVKTSDQLWRIIAFIRSITPPEANPPQKVMPGQYQPPVQASPPQ